MPIMIKPIGTRLGVVIGACDGKVGIETGGGSVKVGKRVGGTSTRNSAARVGSIVAVTNGVEVGGGSSTGKNPLTSTRSPHTQATPPGTPG